MKLDQDVAKEPASQTDWERFDAMTDDDIDTSDSPPLTEDFFRKAQWVMPGEKSPRSKKIGASDPEQDLGQ